MRLPKSAFPFLLLCAAIGLMTVGCNPSETPDDSPTETSTELTSTSTSAGCSGCCAEAKQETVVCAKCGQEKPAGANAEGCADCPDGQCTEAGENEVVAKPAGCCGKCAESKQETVICAKCGQEKSSGTKAEGCADCPAGQCTEAGENGTVAKPVGCCGKCAESKQENGAVAKPAVGESPIDTEASDVSATGQHGQQTSNFANDRDVFHFLLSNNDKITRTVTVLDHGVETLTESSDPTIAEKIQEHVAAMYQRVENDMPIRMRDPLYREVFKHTDQINMKLEKTANGIRVTETSDDEYVTQVIQAHAKVVSGFVEHGFEEARKNHEPPQKQ